MRGLRGVRLGRKRGQNNPDNVCIFRRTLTPACSRLSNLEHVNTPIMTPTGLRNSPFLGSFFVRTPRQSPRQSSHFFSFGGIGTVITIAEPIVTSFKIFTASFVQYLTQLIKINFTLLFSFLKCVTKHYYTINIMQFQTFFYVFSQI